MKKWKVLMFMMTLALPVAAAMADTETEPQVPAPQDPAESAPEEKGPREGWDAFTEENQRYFAVTRNCEKLAHWSSIRNDTRPRFLVFLHEFKCGDVDFVITRVSDTNVLRVYRKRDLILNQKKHQ